MRVCLISQEYPPETARGGIGTQTWNKARALVRLGHTVEVLSCATQPVGSVVETEPGLTVHRMPAPGKATDEQLPIYEPAVYSLGYSWSVLRHLSLLMETTGFDLINFPEYGAEGFAFLLNRTVWNRVPVVIQLHGPLSMFVARVGWPPAGSEQARVGIFMEETSIRLADALMASSANIADFTAEAHGVPREAIDVVHCGVDTDVFRPDEQPGREGARPTVLFAGNMAPNKGVNTVFEAGLRLRAKYPDLRLQFLGKADPELIERLRSRARAAGAVANLELLGYVADRDRLPALYRGADVFCSPARHEVGVANVYVEAMACGCPVVASTTGGAPEGVEHGRSGLLVPPNDVDATAAREIATEYFDAGRVLDRLVQEAMRSGGRSTAP